MRLLQQQPYEVNIAVQQYILQALSVITGDELLTPCIAMYEIYAISITIMLYAITIIHFGGCMHNVFHVLSVTVIIIGVSQQCNIKKNVKCMHMQRI